MIDIKKHRDIITFCKDNNTETFNLLKAVEEANEFIEAIVKQKTKWDIAKKKVTFEDIVSEYGDMIFRGIVYINQISPGYSLDQIIRAVNKRIDDKTSFLERWIDERDTKSVGL